MSEEEWALAKIESVRAKARGNETRLRETAVDLLRLIDYTMALRASSASQDKVVEGLREGLKKALVRFANISKMSAPIRPSGHSELCGLVDELESQGLIGMGEVEAALARLTPGKEW